MSGEGWVALSERQPEPLEYVLLYSEPRRIMGQRCYAVGYWWPEGDRYPAGWVPKAAAWLKPTHWKRLEAP